MVYVGYLIINHKYERGQDRHEEWHDAITDLCSQSGPLIRKLADSLHQKVTDRVGHVEITDWSMVKERCDDVCKCTYEFTRKIATRGDKFSVSIFLKKVENEENYYNMISRISYDGHCPASYNVFRKESEIASYYYVGLFKKSITKPSILATKEAIEGAFCDTDGVNYSQYVAIPIACTGNKMIALLQIVAYEDSIIAKDRDEIEKIAGNYLSSYTNLVLLTDKVDHVVHNWSKGV